MHIVEEAQETLLISWPAGGGAAWEWAGQAANVASESNAAATMGWQRGFDLTIGFMSPP
jgi:hypothetical protein